MKTDLMHSIQAQHSYHKFTDFVVRRLLNDIVVLLPIG